LITIDINLFYIKKNKKNMSDNNFRYNSQESRKNQAYRSLANYPYPEPRDIFRINPLCLNSLKNLDVDDLQDVFGKNFQDKRSYEESQKLMKEVIINESPEIKEIRDAIEHAKLNQILAKQMNQNMLLRTQKLMKEAEEEELVLQEIENEKKRKKEEEEKKKVEFLKNREINLQQIRDKKLLQEQAEKEYERDKKLVDDMIRKMQEEDLAAKKEEQRKRDINKLFMQNAFKERDLLKQKEKENDKKQDEEIRKYHEEIARREKNLIQKKNDLQQKKDKIFNKLCDEEAKRKAEQDYWDNVRADLHFEQDLYKTKKKQKEEEERRNKMREDVVNSALEQMKYKAMKKKEEEELDEKFRQKLLEKYAQDEKLEKERQEKQRQQLIDIQNEIQKQRELKYLQYQKQKEKELQEINKSKEEEDAKKYIIEQEKRRLLRENEELLKKYYPSGYYKVKESLRDVKKPETTTRHDVIYNNIFGNTNPNKSSAYPKYGKIKNFVYDINVQDVHPNINIINYPMYNATANNDYDSYPTPEEYKKMMEKVGQKNYAYAGGDFIKGIPMRSQMPVYNDLNENKYKRKNLTILNEPNLEETNSNMQMSKYSNNERNTLNTGNISGNSTGYYRTESNYNPIQREKYNLARVPEAIN
jgi:hypothetical protein